MTPAETVAKDAPTGSLKGSQPPFFKKIEIDNTGYHRGGGWDYIGKSNAWIGLAIESDHAYFEGKCTIQKYNPETGELIWSKGNYKFKVDVWDNNPTGGIDVYQICVLDKNGVLFHEAGFDSYGYLQVAT